MSGGHFDYKQFEITRIADEIEQLIEINGKKRVGRIESWEEPYHYEYPPEVIEKFKEAVLSLRTAQIYAQRIDWLVSGDDGEESFLRRLKEDMKELNKRNKERKQSE
jgi:hypothetical protein